MSEREKSRLVIDETTIYEIDLECQECQNKQNVMPHTKEESPENKETE